MSTPEIADGWLVLPCNAPEMATVELSVGQGRGPSSWRPAFRDWRNGQRVAQARLVPTVPGTWNVWVRVDGRVDGPYQVVVPGEAPRRPTGQGAGVSARPGRKA